MRILLAILITSFSSLAICQTFVEDTIDINPSLTAIGGDIDGDNDTDIVYVDQSGQVIVAEKISVNNYSLHNIDAGHHFISTIRVADMDNDMDVDIVVGSWVDSVTILENLGSFSFSRTAYYVGNYVSDIEIADFDNDNLLDIVAIARQDDRVYVLENDPTGFVTHLISSPYLPARLDTADFNGDGDMDVIVTGVHGSSGAGQIDWLENNGSFNFTTHNISSVGNYDINAINLDGDTDIDFVTANTFNGEISYWINDGSNSFSKTVIDNIGCCALSIWAEDMNNDGDVDIVAGDENTSGLRLFTNDGALNFTISVIGNDYDTYEFQVLDEDFDGDMDIIQASAAIGPGVSLFRNSLFQPDITPPDTPVLNDVIEECSATVSVPTTTDNVAGVVTGTTNDPLTYSSQGTFVINWTFDDGNGNSITVQQNVIIDDVSAPVADVPSLNNVNSECEVTPATPTATDNCSGSVNGTPDVTFPITSAGTTTVTWTYDDGNGNTSTQTQDVVITPIDVNTTTTPNGSDYTISADANGYNYQWIENCGSTNDVLTGETNQSYAPTSNGTYAVIIDNGTCSDTSDCVIIDDLGINDVVITSFMLYPNPTLSGKFTVSYDGQITAIEVVDMTGRLIDVPTNPETGEVDGSALASGKYTVRVSTEQQGVLLQVISVIR